jgi:hypothetical protein
MADPFVVIAAGRCPFTTDGLLAVGGLAVQALIPGTCPAGEVVREKIFYHVASYYVPACSFH